MQFSAFRMLALAVLVFLFAVLTWNYLSVSLPGGRTAAAVCVGLFTFVTSYVISRIRR